MLSIALVAALASAGTLTCESDGSPEVRYESWSKDGGARPARGETPISRETWTVAGSELFRVQHIYGVDQPQKTRSDLDWKWDVDATTDVEVLLRSRLIDRVRYRSRVTVFRPSGASLGEGLGSETTVWMTCTRERRFGVP